MSQYGSPIQMLPNAGQPVGSGTAGLPSSPMDIIQQILRAQMTPQMQMGGDPRSIFTQAFNQANQANDTRYKQAAGLLVGQGESSKREARESRDSGFAGDTQSLIDRGLYNSSVLDASKRRRDEAYQKQAQGIDESVADRMSGLVERRTDQAPDFGLFASLLQQQGQAQGQSAAQGQKTNSLIMGPRGPNSFMESANAGMGGAGGGSGGGGYGGGSTGGGGSGVGTYTNPGAPGYAIQVQPPGGSKPKKKKQVYGVTYTYGVGGKRVPL